MQSAIVVRGRLVGPRSVELDEPVSHAHGPVEVIVPTDGSADAQPGQSVFDFLRGIVSGQRTREEIDRQIQQERSAWGED